MWKGSGNDFSRLIITRRFHPPMRNHLLDIVVSEWLIKKRAIKLWLAAYKVLGITTNSKCHRDLIFTLTHETLHGVIDFILKSDNIKTNRDIHYHFPFLSGLDPSYKKIYDESKTNVKGYYIEPRI